MEMAVAVYGEWRILNWMPPYPVAISRPLTMRKEALWWSDGAPAKEWHGRTVSVVADKDVVDHASHGRPGTTNLILVYYGDRRGDRRWSIVQAAATLILAFVGFLKRSETYICQWDVTGRKNLIRRLRKFMRQDQNASIYIYHNKTNSRSFRMFQISCCNAALHETWRCHSPLNKALHYMIASASFPNANSDKHRCSWIWRAAIHETM